jgi:hypothetical protein
MTGPACNLPGHSDCAGWFLHETEFDWPGTLTCFSGQHSGGEEAYNCILYMISCKFTETG